MKFFKHTVSLVLGLFLMAGSAVAQGQQMQSAQPDSITDKELETYVSVTKEMQTIQQESAKQIQSEVKTMLADKEMNMQRFRQIMMSRQNPNADSINVTQQEQATIKEMQPSVMKIQRKSQQQMMGVFKNSSMDPQRYQQIRQAVQNNQQLKQRLMEAVKNSQN